MREGHHTVVHDRNAPAIDALVARAPQASPTWPHWCSNGRAARRSPGEMLPAGEATEQTIAQLADLLEADDVIIDGGNTFWTTIRRAQHLAERQLHYVDVGTSGGVWGLERGYCMMIGGEQAVRRLEHTAAGTG